MEWVLRGGGGRNQRKKDRGIVSGGDIKIGQQQKREGTEEKNKEKKKWKKSLQMIWLISDHY